jgi:hypothetical protein
MSQRPGLFRDMAPGREPPYRTAATLELEKDPPPVSGELATDPAALSAAADDFGHVIPARHGMFSSPPR